MGHLQAVNGYELPAFHDLGTFHSLVIMSPITFSDTPIFSQDFPDGNRMVTQK
jgi:hypothetical protein